MNHTWTELDLRNVASPGLLVDADRASANVQKMLDIVGGNASRLRPHVKTHKMPDVVRLQLDAGIRCFKVATLAEAEMVAQAGGKDILIAYQMVGPNIQRLRSLAEKHPNVDLAAVTDDCAAAAALAKPFASAKPLRLFIDVDCGMHRTGIPLGDALNELRDQIEATEGLLYGGLHVYDGHQHDPSLEQRQQGTRDIINAIRQYDDSRPSPCIVGGGSPTFAVWATATQWQCSPGTPVFWDEGYGGNYPDLPFELAIALVTRVISKPGDHRVCLDIGYKSVASEMPLERRLVIPALADAKFIGHSEEHLVVETAAASSLDVGYPLLAFPRHVCPTVALYAQATVIRKGHITKEFWRVATRDR